MDDIKNKQQAIAPITQPMKPEAFRETNNTVIHWLGNAGAFINSHGTCIMLDPLLKGFDMPMLIEMPILPENVPHLDAVLITHCDNDHFSRVTCKDLISVTDSYHGPHYIAELMKEEGMTGIGHNIGETLKIGNVHVTLTPADHAWQNAFPKYATRKFKMEDYCGFWIETPDGTIWMPGDSRFMESHLHMQTPDMILMDFSDSKWHIGLEGAVRLANAYPETPLLLIHWGTVDAPEMAEFNGNPEVFGKLIINPDRMHVMAAGAPFLLKPLKD